VSLLATPVVPADNVITAEVVRDFYNPFTIIPDRPRSEVIQYEVVAGDTIYSIAERFGLRPESIAWANDRALALALRPGNRLNILPVDGVFVAAIGSKTIADLAAEYQVDPYAIIDSEFNDLFDATPDTVLPSGTQIVIPGGQAEQISWNPIVERTGGDGGGGSGSGGVGTISFAPGDPGSCGAVENSGGGSFWQRPIANYTFIRGFSSWHTGVDLASSVGTPVFAANTGRVIFAGWNSWGYGYTVVLAHGPYTTLYGHLDSYNVSCGQLINAGDFVATVGSSGNSSGPHLHFEIRYLDTPTNPVSTIGF
jgi:murein DD-endopeptidase MepM/ murein hydrolase activator NlpD